MVTVPEPRLPSVRPSAQPRPYQSAQAPEAAFGANIAARGLGQVAQAATQAGDLFAQRALQMQGLVNKQAVDDASVRYITEADRLQTEFQEATKGSMSAVEKLPELYKGLETLRGSLAEGLSPEAMAQYNSSTRQYLAAIQGQTTRFAVTQRNQSIEKTAQAATSQAQAKMAGDPANPEIQQWGIAQISSSAASLQALNHWSDEVTQEYLRENLGAVYQGQIMQSLNGGDYPAAQAMYDERKGDMTLQQQNAVSGALKSSQTAFVAQDWADNFVLAETTRETEVDPLQALKTAAPQAKITSTKRTPEKNKAVGGTANSDHLTGEAADFVPGPGQTMSQLAAQLRSARIGQVIQEGDHVHVEWGKGAGKAQVKRPTFDPTMDPATYEANMFAAIEEQSKRDFPNNPVARNQAAAAARSRVSVRAQQLRANQTGAYDRLLNAVATNDLQDPTKLGQAYPGAAQDLALISGSNPRFNTSLQSAMKANANEMTPEREQYVTALNGLRYTNPQSFVNTNLADFDLPLNYRVSLAKQQAAVAKELAKVKKEGKPLPVNTGVVSALNSIQGKAALESLGIDDKNSPEYNQFAGALGAAIEMASKDGKLPDQKTMNQIVSQVTAKVGKDGFFRQAPPAFEVPAAERKKIVDAAREAGVNLTERDIGELYWRRTRAQ